MRRLCRSARFLAHRPATDSSFQLSSYICIIENALCMKKLLQAAHEGLEEKEEICIDPTTKAVLSEDV